MPRTALHDSAPWSLTMTTTQPTSTEAIALACNIVVQAQGDVSKARRAIDAAHAYLCRIDDTYRPEANEALEIVTAAFAALPEWMTAGDGYDSPAMLPQAIVALVELSTVPKVDGDSTATAQIVKLGVALSERTVERDDAYATIDTMRQAAQVAQATILALRASFASQSVTVTELLNERDALQARVGRLEEEIAQSFWSAAPVEVAHKRFNLDEFDGGSVTLPDPFVPNGEFTVVTQTLDAGNDKPKTTRPTIATVAANLGPFTNKAAAAAALIEAGLNASANNVRRVMEAIVGQVDAPALASEVVAEPVVVLEASDLVIDEAAFAHLPPSMRKWALDKARADAAKAAQ